MPFGIVGRTGPGMRQVVGFGDRSTIRGTFGGEFGVRLGPQGPNGRTCATAPRRSPLAKLLWADLLKIQIKRCEHYHVTSPHFRIVGSPAGVIVTLRAFGQLSCDAQITNIR